MRKFALSEFVVSGVDCSMLNTATSRLYIMLWCVYGVIISEVTLVVIATKKQCDSAGNVQRQ